MAYRICYIRSAYYPPIMGTEFYEHSQQAAKLGHHVYVIAIRKEKEPKVEYVGNVKVYRIDIPKGHLKNVFFVLKSLRFLAKTHFDIIHVYAFGKSFILPLLGKFFFKRRRTKWIHNLIQVNTVGGFKGFLQNKKAKFASLFFDAVIVSDNRSDSEIKRRILGCKFPKPCFIVPIGVRADMYLDFSEEHTVALRWKYGITEREVILIYLGALKRNLSTLIRAFKIVSERFKDIRLFIVGIDEEMPNLMELSRKLQIDDKIIFTGYVEYDKVPIYLSIADIGISYIPINDFLDPQPPLKTLEYLSAGLPVIATNTTGNRIFIKHGYNGLLIGDDEESLAEAIKLLVTEPELRRQLARNSHKSIKHLDWRRIVKNHLIPVYAKVIEYSKYSVKKP